MLKDNTYISSICRNETLECNETNIDVPKSPLPLGM